MSKPMVLDQPMNSIYLISSFVIEDERGRLVKDYSHDLFSSIGVAFESAERTILYNRASVLRGMHYQKEFPQAKMIHCIDGRIWAVALNINKNSNDYGLYYGCELTSGVSLLISGDFAVGTLSLTDSIINVDYDSKFFAEHAAGIKWDDKTINIPWPLDELQNDIIISEKDLQLPSFSDICE